LSEVDIYNAIRSEIVSNHVLMHWYSIIIAIVLLVGIAFVENRKTILSVFLPLLTLAWAAAMVRFDFFIHRQAAYLRVVESKLSEQGMTVPMWETWKQSLRSTRFVIPIADVIAIMVIVIPTIYLLFGPAQQFFQHRQWRGRKVYAWTITALILILISSLAVIPSVASWGQRR
jgi:type IV secretory pathway VirB2 component (pilin)